MPYVHDPSVLISAPLTDGTASGTLNVYGTGTALQGVIADLGDPNGNKVNSASYGTPAYRIWGDADANLLGHLVMDVVNSGTVPLFVSATRAAASASTVSGAFAASGSRWDSASSSFSATQVSFTALSMSAVGHEGWAISGTGTYQGPFAADYSSSLSTMSGVLMYALYKASSSLGTALGMQGSLITVQNSSSNYSASLYGFGTPAYTGALGAWPSGVMQTLVDLSSTFYGTYEAAEQHISGSIAMISKLVVGTDDLTIVSNPSGSWTGSYPTATFNNLRPDFYAVSASYYNASASYWPLSAAFSATKLMTDALSASYNLSATSKWDPLSSSFFTLSGNLNSSATIWTANTTAALSTSFYTLSGNLNSSASLWNATSASYWVLSGNLNSSASTWNAAASAQTGMAYLTSSNWNPSGGFFNITGSHVTITSSAASGTHAFGSGALNVDSTWDSIHIRSVTGANFIETWVGANLIGYWSDVGTIAVSGDFVTPGTMHASGGLDCGGTAKVVNMAAGTTTTDAVNYGQFQPVSSSYVATSQTLSGVLASSSLYTPTAIFLKSPNGNIYRIDVDNSGILSSTLV